MPTTFLQSLARDYEIFDYVIYDWVKAKATRIGSEQNTQEQEGQDREGTIYLDSLSAKGELYTTDHPHVSYRATGSGPGNDELITDFPRY